MAVNPKKSEIIDGFTIKYHANGATRWSKGKVNDGKPVGYWEWYRVDDTLKRSGHFDAGEPVGEWITYDQDDAAGVVAKPSREAWASLKLHHRAQSRVSRRIPAVSFQSYLDNIETKTGLTPRQFIELARERGFDETTKAGPILEWLKQDFDLGRGHGMALVHVITKGAQIGDKHVGTSGSHADESDTLWLDGKDTKPTF